MSTLNLRAARPTDAAALARLQHASIQTLAGILPASYLHSKTEQSLFELWNHELKSSLRRTFVAESLPNQLCGLVSFGPSADPDLSDRPAGEILRVYLLPNNMGHGIGSVLLEHGVDVLQKRGYDPIMLWVFEANVRARKFYVENGFEEDTLFRSEDGMRMIRYFWVPKKN
jgi:GNAT superfamily N-acetyltransferase